MASQRTHGAEEGSDQWRFCYGAAEWSVKSCGPPARRCCQDRGGQRAHLLQEMINKHESATKEGRPGQPFQSVALATATTTTSGLHGQSLAAVLLWWGSQGRAPAAAICIVTGSWNRHTLTQVTVVSCSVSCSMMLKKKKDGRRKRERSRQQRKIIIIIFIIRH